MLHEVYERYLTSVMVQAKDIADIKYKDNVSINEIKAAVYLVNRQFAKAGHTEKFEEACEFINSQTDV